MSRLIAALLFLILPAVANAQDAEQPESGSALETEILEAARPTFEAETSGAIEYEVRRVNVLDDWAFAEVTLRRPGGRDIDWQRTKYAEDFSQGIFDPAASFFLAKRENGNWILVQYATGPTDIAWDSWKDDYRLPKELFEREPR